MSSRMSKGRLPAKRSQVTLLVDSKTLGTPFQYRLKTVNVSKSGMLLLNLNTAAKVPFLINTILELTIDPGMTILGQPIKCMAKVVRTEDIMMGEKKVPEKFGVQIIQLENDEMAVWDKMVGAFEAYSGADRVAA